jgi:hypothetical protein
MIASKQVARPASRSPSRNAATRVPGTSLSVAEIYAILMDRRGCKELFQRFPDLDPNDLRDAVEQGGSCQGRVDAQDPTAVSAAIRFCHSNPSRLG